MMIRYSIPALALLLLSYAGFAQTFEFDDDPSGIDPSRISLPEKEGTLLSLSGKTEIDGYSGALSYSIPLPMPQWRDIWALPPLAYNSQAGNGIAGQGFDLNIPRIYRTTQYGVPRSDSPLKSSLHGDLVAIGDQRLRARIDDSWFLYREEGQSFSLDMGDKVYYFGENEESRLGDGTFTSEWLLTRVRDNYGNEVRLSYEKLPQANLSLLEFLDFVNADGRVIYSGRMSYENRNDAWTNHRKGYSQAFVKRLKSFTAYWNKERLSTEAWHETLRQAGPSFSRINHTRLHYTELGVSRRSLLTKVEEFGKTDADRLPTISLNYSHPPLENQTITKIDARLLNAANLPNRPSLTKNTANFVDFNGDGLPDVMGLGAGSQQWKIWLNLGEGRFADPENLSISSFQLNSSFYTIADLNGDRRMDFFYNGSTFLSDRAGSNWNNLPVKAAGLLPASGLNTNKQLSAWIDFDADGKTDYVSYSANSFVVYKNDSSDDAVAFKSGWQVSLSQDLLVYRESQPKFLRWIDINGDGLPDLSYFRAGTDNCTIVYQANLGNGHFGPRRTVSYRGTGFMTRVSRYADLNGDGLTDLLFYKQSSIFALLQDGMGSFEARILDISDLKTNPVTMLDAGDINGNGSTDILLAVNTLSDGLFYWDPLQDHKTKAPYLLEKVTQALGSSTEFEYISSASTYKDGKAFHPLPVTHQLLASKKVLAATSTLDQGYAQQLVEDQSYTYRKGFYDFERNEFYGYAVVEKQQNFNRDKTKGLITRSEFFTEEDSGFLKGKLRKSEQMDARDRFVLQSIINDFVTIDLFPGVKHPFMQGQITINRERDGSELRQRKSFTLELGSDRTPAVRTITDYDKNNRAYRTITTEFEQGSGLRLVNKPKLLELKDESSGTIKRRKSISWNDRGRMEEIREGVGREEAAVKAFSYDSFGNVSEMRDALGYVNKITYDEGEDYLATRVEAQVSQESSAVLVDRYHYDMSIGGKVSKHFDKNHSTNLQAATQYNWDGLARISSILFSGDSEPSLRFRYSWGDNSHPSTVETLQRGVSEPSISLMDALLRPFAKASPAPNKLTVEDFKVFDLQGRESVKSLPFAVDSTDQIFEKLDSKRLIVHEYDVQNRPSYTRYNDGGVESWSYSAHSVTHVNQVGELSRRLTDQFGRLCEYQDINSSDVPEEWYTLPTQCQSDTLKTSASLSKTFRRLMSYDVANQVIILQNQGQTPRLYSYDSRGMKKSIVSKGLGQLTYEYDAKGQLLRRTTFNRVGSELEALFYQYDGLGRELRRWGMVSRGGQSAPKELLFDFTYDADDSTYGKGLLTGLRFGSGEHFSYNYNSRGKVIGETLRLADQILKTAFEYDHLDRLAVVTYPDQEKVQYMYSPETGLLIGAEGGITASVHYDQLQRLQMLNLQENRQTPLFQQNFSYEGLKGRLQQHSGLFSGQEIFSNSYNSYDSLDRIDSMSGTNSVLRNYKKQFAYDLRGQLTRYAMVHEGANRQSQAVDDSFGYFDNGLPAILHNEPVAILLYNDDGLAGLSSAHQNPIFEDFGRLQSTDELSQVEWNALGQIATLQARNGSKAKFGYMPDGKRLFEEKTVQDKVSKIYHLNDYVLFNVTEKRVEKFYRLEGKTYAQRKKEFSFVVSDHLMSQNMLVNPKDGSLDYFAEIRPYGSLIHEVKRDNQPTHLFATGINDRTFGLDQMQTRAYANSSAIFTSPDWYFLEQPEKCVDAVQCNLYSYGRNNPMKYIDPNGRQSMESPAISEIGTQITGEVRAIRDTTWTMLVDIPNKLYGTFSGLFDAVNVLGNRDISNETSIGNIFYSTGTLPSTLKEHWDSIPKPSTGDRVVSGLSLFAAPVTKFVGIATAADAKHYYNLGLVSNPSIVDKATVFDARLEWLSKVFDSAANLNDMREANAKVSNSINELNSTGNPELPKSN